MAINVQSNLPYPAFYDAGTSVYRAAVMNFELLNIHTVIVLTIVLITRAMQAAASYGFKAEEKAQCNNT